MKRIFAVLSSVVLSAIPVGSQTYTCYSDSTSALVREWVSGCDYSESTSANAFEGTKFLDYTYSASSYAVHYPPAWLQLQVPKRFDASGYKYVQFACKIDIEKNDPDTLSFWCIHCNAAKQDAFFKEKAAFKPTTSWKMVTIPMSSFSQDPVDMISSFVFLFSNPGGSRHFSVDDIQFTNSDPVAVRPDVRRSQTDEIQVSRPYALIFETYSLNGTKIAHQSFSGSATREFKEVARLSAYHLPAGVYLVRQSARSGGRVLNVKDKTVIFVR